VQTAERHVGRLAAEATGNSRALASALRSSGRSTLYRVRRAFLLQMFRPAELLACSAAGNTARRALRFRSARFRSRGVPAGGIFVAIGKKFVRYEPQPAS
jgi:hypothetical protein